MAILWLTAFYSWRLICSVYIAIFATFQPVTLWRSDWSASPKLPWMRVQISADRALKERAVYIVGLGSVCKCMGQCTLEGSVQVRGVYTGMQNFFDLFLKLTNQR